MEEDMVVQVVNNGDQSISIEQVIQLVDTLYHSNNPAEQTEADRRLTELQSSDRVWHICWPLLDTTKYQAMEVHFFAANTLVLKINQSWNKHSEQWLKDELRPKLFEILFTYSSSPDANRLIIERLALALATFALHSIPTFWPGAIEDILQTFSVNNLPLNLTPQRVCDILLKILSYIPEEYSVLTPKQEHRNTLNSQITKSGPMVFKFLHSLLQADSEAVTGDCKQGALKCFTSWTIHSQTSILELDEGQTILDCVYSVLPDEELCPLACSALGATFSSQKSENYINAIIDFTPRIAQLGPLLDKYMTDEDVNCVIKLYSLIINFAENHSKLFIEIIIDKHKLEGERCTLVKQSIMTIIGVILNCTSAPGTFGVDEKYSENSFSFWLTFFENFCYFQDCHSEQIRKHFDPLIDSLLQVLMTKSRYPTTAVYYKIWSEEQREAFRCYRQDICDIIGLLMQFPSSCQRILVRLHDSLKQELAVMLQAKDDISLAEQSWQGFEAILLALRSIAEHVGYDENQHIPNVFGMLAQIPFNESHALLYCTAAEMIAAFSDWLYTHTSHLAIAFNLLFLGVNSTDSHVRLMSTLSLKDLTTECQPVLQQFAEQIIRLCTDAILKPESCLNTNEKARLMYAVGTTLAISPTDLINRSLHDLALPLVQDIESKAQADPNMDPSCRPIIRDRLIMLNNMIESLYVKQISGNEYELDSDENDTNRVFNSVRFESVLIDDNTAIIQPALTLIKRMAPVLRVIAKKYVLDEEISGLVGNTITKSTKSLGTDIKPVVVDLLTIIVDTYEPLMNSNMLDGCLSLFLLFKIDNSLHDFLRNTFAQISNKTLDVCINNPLRQLSLTIENYFRFATIVCKRTNFLTDEDTKINIEFLYKLAIASLELPEKRTLAEVCNFLCLFRQKALECPQLHRIFVSQLDLILRNVFMIFGGNFATPRNAIEHVTDLFFALTDADEVRQPLKLIVDNDDFPTSHVTREQKAKFVSMIVHEKNRRKFKDACNQFVLSARNLSRST